MSYDPPKKSDWYIGDTGIEAYNDGWMDAKNGIPFRGDELYPPSGHERETTPQDEWGYQYYRGYYDYDEKDN